MQDKITLWAYLLEANTVIDVDTRYTRLNRNRKRTMDKKGKCMPNINLPLNTKNNTKIQNPK